MIKAYAPQYENFAESDGTAFGSYGARFANNLLGCDMLALAENLLRKNPETRQCVLAIWRPDDIWEAMTGKRKDLPCTTTWQFVVRDGALRMIVTMRSNDVWLGMPYDIFVNTCVQRLLANTLGLRCGDYTHHVGSLHLYERHEMAAQAAMRRICSDFIVDCDFRDNLAAVPLTIAHEQKLRAGCPEPLNADLGPLLRCACDVLEAKWKKS